LISAHLGKLEKGAASTLLKLLAHVIFYDGPNALNEADLDF